MFFLDLPPTAAQQTPVVIAEAAQVTATQTRVDRTIGVCHLIDARPEMRLSADNAIHPLGQASAYLGEHEHRSFQWKHWNVSVLEAPDHGEVEGNERGVFGYFLTTPDYHGPDRATFLVEIDRFKVKVLYFFNVLPAVPGGTEGYDPYEDHELCPHGRVWKISLNRESTNLWKFTIQYPTMSRGAFGARFRAAVSQQSSEQAWHATYSSFWQRKQAALPITTATE